MATYHITIRREMRKGMIEPDYRVTCGQPECKFEDKSDEFGAQRMARKHNNDKHGGQYVVHFARGAVDARVKARERAMDGDDT
jgi:hypothetical protein